VTSTLDRLGDRIGQRLREFDQECSKGSLKGLKGVLRGTKVDTIECYFVAFLFDRLKEEGKDLTEYLPKLRIHSPSNKGKG